MSDISDLANTSYKSMLGRSVGAIRPVRRGVVEVGDCGTLSNRWNISDGDAGTRIVVVDPDHLLVQPDNQRSYRLFNATSMTVNGPVTVGGDVDDQWRVFDGGNNLRLSFMRGLTLILR